PDETTVEYLRGRKYVPEGDAFEQVAADWLSLASDEGAEYDKSVSIHSDEIEPFITWGTNPGMGAGINGHVPYASDFENELERDSFLRAIEYMGLEEG